MKKLMIKAGSQWDRGQVVLILVLLTVVGLTIGLSLISRTITDVRISSQIEQSSRAFSAAEAGIETALSSNIAVGPTGTVNLPGASANYAVKTIGGTSDIMLLPLTQEGDTQNVWLIGHNDDDSLNEAGIAYPVDQTLEICWGSKSGASPAMLISIFYKDSGQYKIAKKVFDPGEDHHFLPADEFGPYCGSDWPYRKRIVAATDADSVSEDFDISPTSQLLLLRLQPILSATSMAVKPAAALPAQGRVITSIGQTNTNIVRKIQVNQSYPVLPTLLDYSFFSENN